jgi:hypothetical protein
MNAVLTVVQVTVIAYLTAILLFRLDRERR